MAKLKNGWVKKIIDGVSEKIFAISHVKSTYYNYTEGKLLSDKLDEIENPSIQSRNQIRVPIQISQSPSVSTTV